ncbi:RecX family transcriptional regulator [Agreia sp. VKM Ac-1783]|uniref:regulatory protein RecX n=1 Tax=Agreia sp. VKM Ac-1783 TaxID=1938889 RepID=UPI000A2AA86A|nr:RecX family transcriptional regulator [Agreia sp. VKM Ac-1783]SMQ63847.1 regulatory protein [Agreia sp. VKM Ac-1783]
MVRFSGSSDSDDDGSNEAADSSVAPVAFLFGAPDEQQQPARHYAGPVAVPTLDTTGLTPEQVDQQELQLADLENLVVRALARKDLSEWQVTEILAANGVESSAFEGFLTIYRSKGYVDDYAFAEREIERLHRRKGFGRSQIQRELGAKRVSQEIVSDVLTSLDDDDELARALELAEKKAPSLLRLDRATAERRLSSFLQRKGYPSQVVRDAVSKTLVSGTSTVRFR